MDSHRSRTEGVISLGRVGLAAFSLLAAWLQPLEHARSAGAARVLLFAYAPYAIAAALAARRATVHVQRLQVVTNAADLGWITALLYLTDGATSPFVAYLVFVLVAATLRWRLRGTVWTAAIVLAGLVGLGFYDRYVLDDRPPQTEHLIMLGACVAVVSMLLGFSGLHETRLREEVGRLAIWARDWRHDVQMEARVCRMVASAAGAFGARRAVFAWRDGDDPRLQLVQWDGREAMLSRVAADVLEPLVEPDLADKAFLCRDAGEGGSAVFEDAGGLSLRRGVSINPELRHRFDIEEVVSVPVEVEGGGGRFFFMGKAQLSTDDLTLARIMGRAASVALADGLMRERLRDAAAVAERVRLARDLHDGVLQSLTAVGLQLATVCRRLESQSPAAAQAVAAVQVSLEAEQRELRLLIDMLTLGHKTAPVFPSDVRARLTDVRDSISRQWGLPIDLSVGALEASGSLSEDLVHDLVSLVREGLVNTARHARATRAKAAVVALDDHLEIVIEDDGGGFPFEGRHDGGVLRSQGLGPATLVERVEGRGGEVTVTSGRTGSRLAISLPLDDVAAPGMAERYAPATVTPPLT